MGDGNYESKKTHFDNLWKMVRYCENVHECRRALQLEYFGEVFDTEKCGEVRATTCDNCLAVAGNTVEKQDITELAVRIVTAVQRFNTASGYMQRNVTVNFLVDVWRGADNAKLRAMGWKTDPLYGTGKGQTVLEANRILKKLVLDGLLWEELIVTKEGGATGYLRPGPKARELLQGGHPPILHIVMTKKTAGSRREEEEHKDPEVVELQVNCFEELKNVILSTAMSRGGSYKTVNQVIPLQGITAISQVLPVTEGQLEKMDHMSKERMKDYKAVILEVTRGYYKMKMDFLASQQELRRAGEEEQDFQPSSQVSSSSRGAGGWRGKGRGRGKAAFKRKRGGSQGGGVAKRGKKGGWRGRGGGGSRGGGGGGSMGLPVSALPRGGYGGQW